MKRYIDYNLSCYQEEADTKMVYHICQLNGKYRANFKYLKDKIEVVVNLSTSTKKMYLDVNKIHKKLGDQLCSALAICHIFTGNDYNPSFYRKGKKRPFNILKKKCEVSKVV